MRYGGIGASRQHADLVHQQRLVATTQMPEWLATPSDGNPLTLTLNACRQALLLGEAPSAWRSLRPLVALSLVLFWLVAVTLRLEERGPGSGVVSEQRRLRFDLRRSHVAEHAGGHLLARPLEQRVPLRGVALGAGHLLARLCELTGLASGQGPVMSKRLAAFFRCRCAPRGPGL